MLTERLANSPSARAGGKVGAKLAEFLGAMVVTEKLANPTWARAGVTAKGEALGKEAGGKADNGETGQSYLGKQALSAKLGAKVGAKKLRAKVVMERHCLGMTYMSWRRKIAAGGHGLGMD